MTKQELLSAQREAKKKLQQLKSEAMGQMTFELEDKIERARLNLDNIEYYLEAFEHTGEEEITCLLLPIN